MIYNKSKSKFILHKVVIVTILLFTILTSCNFPKSFQKFQRYRLSNKGFSFVDLKSNGNRHFYYKYNGKQQTIVLLHGFGADGITQWYKTAILLGKNYNVIVPDLLNHGFSIDSIPDFSIKAQANYINQILDTLNITSKVTVLGNSYGGLVATEFSYSFPHRIDKLILNDAVTKFFSQKTADSAAQALGFSKVIQVLSPSNIYDFKKTLGLVYYHRPYIPKFILKQMLAPSFTERQELNKNILQHLIDNENYYLQRNYTFGTNTFLIWGNQDRLIPKYTATRFIIFYHLPEKQLYVIDKAAHAPNMEHPKKFVKIVQRILESK